MTDSLNTNLPQTNNYSTNKRSFMGPCGVVRGLDPLGGPMSGRRNWSPWSPVVSLGLPLLPFANFVWGHSLASHACVGMLLDFISVDVKQIGDETGRAGLTVRNDTVGWITLRLA